mmetsp:Transcript_13494/g.36391  ORF Transcript_13494/g.36391 Transcript_13494/m.36391 type:complete len:168 (-) Transcript_13494:29-532(-)
MAHGAGHGASRDDWSERNGRHGIAFDYGAASSGRRRSRSRGTRADERRQQRKEDERRDMRDRRKALWGGGATGDSGASKSNGGSSAASSVARGEEHETPTVSANEWERSSFKSSEEKSKFLRLMGAKESLPADGDAKHRVRESDRDLEQQYWKGMRQHMGYRTRGLG